ncbi:MAG: CCA tRNA nucleotidyltransferase [Tenericutes bacterium]|nr:CCA tRNA nucleotidyltransferase [Mycoplasmatota bacterium]
MNEVINKIIDNGFESFIVGGYVRDYILGIKSFDIDICTNAKIDDLKRIFKNEGKADEDYFSYHLSIEEYNYDITSYREELAYSKNKPIKIVYAKDLKTDLLRRDFTMNTLAIDKDGKLVDLLNSKKDIENKIIKVVGNEEQKFNEDKTRILRAIRFSSTLDFELDNKIIAFIKKNTALLNQIPAEFKKKELDKIFESKNYIKFFELVKDLKLMGPLNIKFTDVKESYDRYGIWAQVNTSLPFSNKEKSFISKIKNIIDKGEITLFDLFTYNDIIIKNSAFILGVEEDLKYFEELKDIHSIIDIDINISDISKYIDVKSIKKVYKIIEKNIMEGNLFNNKESIIEFLENKDYE